MLRLSAVKVDSQDDTANDKGANRDHAPRQSRAARGHRVLLRRGLLSSLVWLHRVPLARLDVLVDDRQAVRQRGDLEAGRMQLIGKVGRRLDGRRVDGEHQALGGVDGGGGLGEGVRVGVRDDRVDIFRNI